MGGLPPLGYEVRDRKLVVSAAEAETVRHIFRRYAAVGSVRALEAELEADGIVSKRRIDRFGRESGGRPLARGALYLMLQNRIYRGEIVHKDQAYPGEHEAIVDAALWDEVQRTLSANRVARRTGANAAAPSLLAGLLFDDAGERMIPTHANKKGTRYRYYVSQTLIKRGRPQGAGTGWRVPAGDLEQLVEARIASFLGDSGEVHEAVESLAGEARERHRLVSQAAAASQRWPDLPPAERRALLQALAARIEVRREWVDSAIRPRAILLLGEDDPHPLRLDPCRSDDPTVRLSVPARLQRAGLGMRLLVEGTGGGPRGEPDLSLLRLIAMAHHFRMTMLQEQAMTVTELAEQAGVSPSYFSRVLRLSFLSPDIVRAILQGRHSPQLTARRLMSQSALARSWSDQARQLGIA